MRTIIALGLVAVLILGLVPAPVEAGHNFGAGFAAGAAAVLFLHHVSHPPVFYYPGVPVYPVYYYYPGPVYYYSPPVYYYAPAPPCQSVWIEGGWREVPRDQGRGVITYYREWVPAYWQRVCP